MAVAKHYNLVEVSLGSDLLTSDTSIDFDTALVEGGVNVPSLSGGDWIWLKINSELMKLTAYTAGATTGTVLRAQGDTIEASHNSGDAVRLVSTKDDFVRATESPKAYRYNDVGSPLSLTANIDTAITEAFFDAEDYADTGIAWENANDGYRLTEAGLYEVVGYLDLDSSAISTGHVYLKYTGDGAIISPQTPDIPYGSGVDMSMYLPYTGWFDAGALLQMRVRSTEAVTVTYGEIHVRRVLLG